jgi:hypothetical protein
MAEVDNLSDTWTSAEAYAWRECYFPLFAGISLPFCVFVQVLFRIVSHIIDSFL